MVDLRAQLLPVLGTHRIPDLDVGGGLVYPNYGGYSLANLPSTVCAWLGMPALGLPALAPEIRSTLSGPYQHVILVLIDGFGLDTFTRLMEEDHDPFWNQFKDQGMIAPITSITPSTTAAALTTLWTGVPPAQHGMMGYEMWLKEYSMIVNAITHAPMTYASDPGSLRKAGFQPETFLSIPRLGQHLLQNGVHPFAYHHYSIANSSLSTMLLSGLKSNTFSTLSDLWVGLERNLESVSKEPTYSYVYWGSLDELGHRYGPLDIRASLELSIFTRQLAGFVERLRARRVGRTLLVVTADHGMLPTPPNPRYDIRVHPDLLSCLTMLPSGEHRFAYLYLHPGKENQLREYTEATWPGEFKLLPSEKILSSGLLGPGSYDQRVPERIGDWVAIAQGQAYWWWENKDNMLWGRHGGLSPTEMLIPLLALPL